MSLKFCTLFWCLSRGVWGGCWDGFEGHPVGNIFLLYGNKTVEDIVYKEEFDYLQKKNNNLKVIYTLNNPPSKWEGYTGYIDAELIKKEVSDYASRVFYICGPPSMVEAMKGLLQELNILSEQIKTENFFGY